MLEALKRTMGQNCDPRLVLIVLALASFTGCLRSGNKNQNPGDAQGSTDTSDGVGADVQQDLSGLDQAGLDGVEPDVVDSDTLDPGSVVSSDERIDQALASGTIDQKTAALYGLLAQFSPDRLPEDFQSDVTGTSLPSIVPMRIARQNIGQYSADEAAAVNAMLTSPDDPEWLVFPPGMAVMNAGAGAGACRAGFSTTSAAARVIGLVTDTKHFRIKAIAPVGATEEVKKKLLKRLSDGMSSNTPGVGGKGSVMFLDYLDQVYEYYLNEQGMKDPSSLAAPAANGGRIPIYVALCDGQSNDAFAEPNDGYIFVSVGIGFEDAVLRRVVIPHETFHVFQAAYDVPATSKDWSWVYDGSAVAAEDLVAPDVRRWSGSQKKNPNVPSGFGDAMGRSFQCPEEPLHTDLAGRCKHRSGGAKQYDGSYSKFVVFKFLMRNYGLKMGTFWGKLKTAGGDPRELFDDQQMGQLQLALMGDLSGADPYFEAGDRAAFFTTEGASPDLDANDPDRYTYRMNPAAWKKSVAYRVTPTTDSSLSSTLKKLDNSSQAIQPGGGTQRVLLEIPEEVASISAGSCGAVFAFQAYVEFANCSECTVNLVAVSPSGAGPGRTLDDSSDDADAFATPSALTSKSWSVDEGVTIPRFILAVITNHGSAAATFKAGMTVQQACTHDCMEEYGKKIEGFSCPEFWCDDPCVGAGTCNEWYQNCLASYKDQLPGMPGTFCLYLCNGDGYPYAEENDPECHRWLKSTCDASGVSDCKTIPSDFVPIPNWPTSRCQTFMVSDPEECK